MRDTLIAASSCQYPPDFFRQRESYKSLGAIAEHFSKPENEQFYKVMMLAGDSIYADATAGLMDAKDPHERFTQQYHKLKNGWAWRKFVPHERLFSIDDHELINDWAPLDDKHPDSQLHAQRVDTLTEGKKAFIAEMKIADGSDNRAYYNWIVNCTPIFVMDARTEREARNAVNIKYAKMIHDNQMDSLCRWIDKAAEEDRGKPDAAVRPKIIMSGSMLLPRLCSTAEGWKKKEYPFASSLRSDGWDGFPRTLHRVLAYIAEKGLRRVIFLSGDAHIPSISEVHVKSESHGTANILSVHASGLNAPLPFANAKAEDFQANESFSISTPKGTNALDVSVKTTFPKIGDGFCTIQIGNLKNRHTCQICFAGKRTWYEPIQVAELTDAGWFCST